MVIRFRKLRDKKVFNIGVAGPKADEFIVTELLPHITAGHTIYVVTPTTLALKPMRALHTFVRLVDLTEKLFMCATKDEGEPAKPFVIVLSSLDYPRKDLKDFAEALNVLRSMSDMEYEAYIHIQKSDAIPDLLPLLDLKVYADDEITTKQNGLYATAKEFNDTIYERLRTIQKERRGF